MILDFMITEGGRFGYEYLANFSRSGISSNAQCEKIIAKRVEILEQTHEMVKNIIVEHKGVFDKIVSLLESKHLLSRDELVKLIA